MQQRVTTLKTDRNVRTPQELLDLWHRHLEEEIGSAGTVKKYTQAVARFLAWYEQEEHAPLQLTALTSIALIGYRNDLQHEQHKSTSTINVQVSALRSWCDWMSEQGYFATNPGICQTGRWRGSIFTQGAEKRAGQCAAPPGPASLAIQHATTLLCRSSCKLGFA